MEKNNQQKSKCCSAKTTPHVILEGNDVIKYSVCNNCHKKEIKGE